MSKDKDNSVDTNDKQTMKDSLIKERRELEKERAQLNSIKEELEKQKCEAIAGFPSHFEEFFKPAKEDLEKVRNNLEREMQKIVELRTELSEQKRILSDREFEIQTKEQELANELQIRKNKFEMDLLDEKSKKLSELEQYIATERNKRLDNLETEINKTINERISSAEKTIKDRLDKITAKEAELEKYKQNLETEYNQKLSKVTSDQIKLDCENKNLSVKEDFIKQRESKIEDEVQNRVQSRLVSFNETEKQNKDEIERLRSELRTYADTESIYADLKNQLGGKDPKIVLDTLNTMKNEINQYRTNLNSWQDRQQNKDIEAFKNQIAMLNNRISELESENNILQSKKNDAELTYKIHELEKINVVLDRERQAFENSNKLLLTENERLTSLYGTTKNREERIKDVTNPYFILPKIDFIEDDNAMDWELKYLDNIIKQSNDYGISFPKRLVYAFHTCLKTSEWSPLTVLAGVSGTGKSELPRFYSTFGLMKFLSVPVQPNWDSQESMLGYFNSIDNRFDAQPILRFLAQATMDKSNEYPNGLKNAMNLILLDEMNLAHVELYFADFLSKLESRRGKYDNLPAIDVKLGAGITPYQLELTRNVIWVGTMNQDETTKSLSDKVLDRGNVIFFPRPKELVSRKNLRKLPEVTSNLLSPKVWSIWCQNELKIPVETIAPFKRIVEEINDSLACVGRAIGHRVWQSIEYYINNYPTIIEANNKLEANSAQTKAYLKNQMKIAFEDALVQKVMPKLRGIETSGDSKLNCLDKIKTILSNGIDNKPFDIIEDFNLACNNPFGQFIWNSANYIIKSEEKENLNKK